MTPSSINCELSNSAALTLNLTTKFLTCPDRQRLADEIFVLNHENEIIPLEGRKQCGGKGENTGYQHFFLFPTMFSKFFCHGK